ncbi:MAG: PEP-CTERM sorting domain-containing protein [Snowella sp.]|nr:PEP-CTERM sorting domain-containing protein [Snowella sp.]
MISKVLITSETQAHDEQIHPLNEFTSPPFDPAVPEPFTILGSATALGLGASFKRRLAKATKG